MHQLVNVAILSVALVPLSGTAQETPPAMIETYDALADTILSVKRAEVGFIRALLGSYMEAARADFENRDYTEAAANMALFANEGGNAIAGIRKRLVEGGHHHHHHHASDDDTDDFDHGYVIVDKAHKASLIEAAAQMRQARKKSAAKAAWNSFETTAQALLAAE